jgi:hypothetical protein
MYAMPLALLHPLPIVMAVAVAVAVAAAALRRLQQMESDQRSLQDAEEARDFEKLQMKFGFSDKVGGGRTTAQPATQPVPLQAVVEMNSHSSCLPQLLSLQHHAGRAGFLSLPCCTTKGGHRNAVHRQLPCGRAVPLLNTQMHVSICCQRPASFAGSTSCFCRDRLGKLVWCSNTAADAHQQLRHDFNRQQGCRQQCQHAVRDGLLQRPV